MLPIAHTSQKHRQLCIQKDTNEDINMDRPGSVSINVDGRSSPPTTTTTTTATTSSSVRPNPSIFDKKELLLGVPLHLFTPTQRFIFCSLAVFFFYVLYGYMLELIFRLDGMQSHGWYLTLIQFAYYTFFAVIQLYISERCISRNKIPLKTYIIISGLTVGTIGFSNASMGYLNYPTQVIFKSCKLIPVMIGSIIILGKRYNSTQVLACLCMSFGLIWFTLADSALQPNFTFYGILTVCLSLVCDSVIGNVQERAMKKYNEDTPTVVLYSYSIGFIIIFIILTCTQTLLPAVIFASKNTWEVYGRCAVLSAAGFCGVQVVLTLIRHHGALIAVTVTTLRKAISIILSFIFFAKPFTFGYVWGGLLVALGIYLNIYSKTRSTKSSGKDGSFILYFQKLCLALQKFSITKNRTLQLYSKTSLLDV